MKLEKCVPKIKIYILSKYNLLSQQFHKINGTLKTNIKKLQFFLSK